VAINARDLRTAKCRIRTWPSEAADNTLGEIADARVKPWRAGALQSTFSKPFVM